MVLKNNVFNKRANSTKVWNIGSNEKVVVGDNFLPFKPARKLVADKYKRPKEYYGTDYVEKS